MSEQEAFNEVCDTHGLDVAKAELVWNACREYMRDNRAEPVGNADCWRCGGDGCSWCKETQPAPAVAQEPIYIVGKGWQCDEMPPAGTKLYTAPPAVAQPPAEVVRELVEALNDFSNYVHAEQSSTDGQVRYSNTQINRLAFKARSALAKAKEHGL